jgi:hypothetical protein
LHSATGLKAKDLNGSSDPYVIFKFGMEPEVRSSNKQKTVAPRWEETIVISDRVSAALLASGKLSVTVMDKDSGKVREMLSQTDDKIGECVVALNVLDGKESHEFKQALSPKGTIHFTVSFKPKGGPSQLSSPEDLKKGSITGKQPAGKAGAAAPAPADASAAGGKGKPRGGAQQGGAQGGKGGDLARHGVGSGRGGRWGRCRCSGQLLQYRLPGGQGRAAAGRDVLERMQ